MSVAIASPPVPNRAQAATEEAAAGRVQMFLYEEEVEAEEARAVQVALADAVRDTQVAAVPHALPPTRARRTTRREHA